MKLNFFTDMMVRIVLTIIIEDGILYWLLLLHPENQTPIVIGMVLITILSLGVQLWFDVHRYKITV